MKTTNDLTINNTRALSLVEQIRQNLRIQKQREQYRRDSVINREWLKKRVEEDGGE